MTDEREEALRLLLERLKTDGGRYLLSIALSREELDKEPPATYGGRANKRWLSDEEYSALIECLARAQPQGEPVAWLATISTYADHSPAKSVSLDRSVFLHVPKDKIKIEPLYASPPAQAVPEGPDVLGKLLATAPRGIGRLLDEVARKILEGAARDHELIRLAYEIGRYLKWQPEELSKFSATPKPGGKPDE